MKLNRINIMATRRVDIGPSGETVRFNLRRFREQAGLTLRSLADRLESIGRPLSHTVLSQIETGGRRVDVDDLVALAIALNVTPNSLLFPPTTVGGLMVELSGGDVSATEVWDWARGERPLNYRPSVPKNLSVNEAREHFKRERELHAEDFRRRVSPAYPEDPGPGVYFIDSAGAHRSARPDNA